jgi:hypothetical protein
VGHGVVQRRGEQKCQDSAQGGHTACFGAKHLSPEAENLVHFLDILCRNSACPKRNRGVTYSRPTTGTRMPLQERFGARPIWACLVACPVHEITSFVVDSSRSRKSVFQLFKSHTSFSGHLRIEGTGQVIMQAAIFAGFQRGPLAGLFRFKNAFVPRIRSDFVASRNDVRRTLTWGNLRTAQHREAKRRVTHPVPCPSLWNGEPRPVPFGRNRCRAAP